MYICLKVHSHERRISGASRRKDRIQNADLRGLYTFALTENAEDELFRLTCDYEKRFMDRHFKSLEVLGTL